MNILFLCTGNICRSPMAEGILNHLAKQRGLDMHATSAGISSWEAGHDPATDYAVQALRSLYNIDISRHWSTYFQPEQVQNTDLIVCMERHHADYARRTTGMDNIVLLNEWAYGDKHSGIADPWGRSLQVYEECAQDIYRAIAAALDKDNYDSNA